MALRSLRIHGNEFDQQYAQYATNYFPKYEEFWARYIGCDSSDGFMSRELEILGICYNDSNDVFRKVLGQWNYTIFLNYIHLDELSKAIPPFSIEDFTNLERIYLLTTHLYYTSIECIKMIGIKLKLFDENKNIGIRGFSHFRNIMAHNVRPLVKIIDHNYCVIDPVEMTNFENINQNQRADSPIWSDGYNLRTDSRFISLQEFIGRLVGSLYSEFDTILAQELSSLKTFPQLDDAPGPTGSMDRYGKPIVSGMDFWGRTILPKSKN